jgi:hypothetical protein
MVIIDKLPLPNSKSKIVKIFGYALYAFVILMVIGAISTASPVSMDVAGWEFSADPGDEWKTDLTVVSEEFDDWSDCYSEFKWHGTSLGFPLFIPKESDEQHYSGDRGRSGFLHLTVLDIPEELKSKSTAEILTQATDARHCPTVGLGDDEDLTFDGKEAHLWTLEDDWDDRAVSISTIAVKLSDSQIGIIEAQRREEPDSTLDVINSFTISPA